MFAILIGVNSRPTKIICPNNNNSNNNRQSHSHSIARSRACSRARARALTHARTLTHPCASSLRRTAAEKSAPARRNPYIARRIRA